MCVGTGRRCAALPLNAPRTFAGAAAAAAAAADTGLLLLGEALPPLLLLGGAGLLAIKSAKETVWCVDVEGEGVMTLGWMCKAGIAWLVGSWLTQTPPLQPSPPTGPPPKQHPTPAASNQTPPTRLHLLAVQLVQQDGPVVPRAVV